MTKIEITKTELVWPGKYREDGSLAEAPRTRLPLQPTELFGPDAEWRNQLIWGDNLLAMGSLCEKFAGKIDLIYIDPPFATGADFSIGSNQVAYRDTWKFGFAGYLKMIVDRLRLMRDLLSPRGSLFLHCDWHVSHLLRTAGDEVFGGENFLNEIVWYYYNKFQGNVKRFASNHDVVLWYRNSAAHQFNQQMEKRAEGKVKQLVRLWDKQKAAIVNAKGTDGKVMYRETDERTVDDVWRISMLQPADRRENCGFPTQKPEALLRRIVEAASSPGDLVADFFCGSGTLPSVAEKLHRRWIGCDFGRWAIHTTRKRLLGIRECKPFAVLTMGKYERQHWQGVTFPAQCDYVAFMLKLYGAEPVLGQAQIQGKKGDALVYVGAVDVPMTKEKIYAAVEECAGLKHNALHALGWDWETERCGPMIEAAGQKGIKLLPLQIPREVMEPQAGEKGDLRFLSFAHLEAEIQQSGHLTARVALKNFLVLNAELIPPEVCSDWSCHIDYWAVDWESHDDTFTQGWAAYRTRKERKLPLESGWHTYQKAGRHRIQVRVIDIFGEDTRQAYEVDFSSRNAAPPHPGTPMDKSEEA
jgi:adenine-specific DNA-methyltransferase